MSKSKHFTKVEQKFQLDAGSQVFDAQIDSDLGITPKSTPIVKKNSNISKIHNIRETVNLENPQTENIAKIGYLFENEVKERVGFDIDSYHLGRYHKEVERHNQEILSEICLTGRELKSVEDWGVEGYADELNRAAMILPANVIASLDIMNIKVGTVKRVYEELVSDTKYDEIAGIVCYKPKIDPVHYYVGINKDHRIPHCQTYIHELTHLVQTKVDVMNRQGKIANEEEIFYDYISNAIEHSNERKENKGFPNSYMAENSKSELFPVATNDLFYILDKNSLYRRNRHPNSHLIRQWAFGYWVVLDKQLSLFDNKIQCSSNIP